MKHRQLLEASAWFDMILLITGFSLSIFAQYKNISDRLDDDEIDIGITAGLSALILLFLSNIITASFQLFFSYKTKLNAF